MVLGIWPSAIESRQVQRLVPPLVARERKGVPV